MTLFFYLDGDSMTICSCKECGLKPDEIYEYTDSKAWKDAGVKSATEFVKKEEGTYNPISELFWCTRCYIILGMPLGTA